MVSLDIPKVGDLQVAQDMRYQRRSWFVQRVGWAVMLLVLLAAVAGVFGEGPVGAGAVAAEDGSFSVLFAEYPRKRAPETLRFRVNAGAVEEDELRVAFSRGYLSGVELQSVYPEPDSVETGATEIVFVFTLSEEGLPAEVLFNVLYDDIGRKQGNLRLEGHPAVRIRQFVYP